MDLYTEHMKGTANGLVHVRFDQLQERNLKPEYLDHKVVGSESEDHAYLVSKVLTLTKPQKDADVVEDSVKIVMCSCDGYWYNCSAGLEANVNPADANTCKHGRSAYKELRAKADESQTELVE